MAAIIINLNDPNEHFTPLTLSGTEDTITINGPTNGRTVRIVKLYADGGVVQVNAFAAGGIAADRFIPVPGGGSIDIQTGKQQTIVYCNGAAGVKVRPWVIN
jgi:hypothetical protein